MKINDIINRTMRLVRDYRGDGQDGRIWAWDEANRAALSTVYDLAISTGILKAIRLIRVKEEQYIYNMPPDCIRLLRASYHGLDGQVILPMSRGAMDYCGIGVGPGEPAVFFRDILTRNQIGFAPYPVLNGSNVEKKAFAARVYEALRRDSEYGLLRGVVDLITGAYIRYDDDSALRDVDGITITDPVYSGGGLVSPEGHIITGISVGHEDVGTASPYGVIRRVTNPETGETMPFDAEKRLEHVRGVPFVRSFDGRILREFLTPNGNIQVTYVRTPYVGDDGAIDSEIPEYALPYLKYGAAVRLLRSVQNDKLSALKLQYFSGKWELLKNDLKRYAEHKGQLDGVRAI